MFKAKNKYVIIIIDKVFSFYIFFKNHSQTLFLIIINFNENLLNIFYDFKYFIYYNMYLQYYYYNVKLLYIYLFISILYIFITKFMVS
jgi:hypothetical protein